MNWTPCKALLAAALLAAGCNSDDGSSQPAGSAGEAGSGGTSSGGTSSGGTSSGGTSSGGATTGGTSTGGASTGGASSAGAAGEGGGAAGAAGGGGGDAMTVEICLSEAIAADTQTERLEFSGEGVSVGLVRFADPDMMGTSGTTPWLAERFAVTRGAEAACVTDPGALDYQSSYHNFDDSLAVTAEGTTYAFTQVREGYSTAATFTVSASGAATWGPLTLTLVSCTRLGSNEDCATRYQAAP